MIILITTYHVNRYTREKSLIVSHGFRADTGETVVLPQVHPREVGGVFDTEIGEWVIRD